MQNASIEEFVEFWSNQYNYKNNRFGNLYEQFIKMELSREKLENLFIWKNGGNLSAKKASSIKNNFIEKITEIKLLNKDSSPKELIKKFQNGGAIWRIFFLHCWNQDMFPIYDQHVHRAMKYIKNGKIDEIPKKDEDKIDSYLNEYIQFYKKFQIIDDRKVDKALWTFGKFLKEYQNQPVISDE